MEFFNYRGWGQIERGVWMGLGNWLGSLIEGRAKHGTKAEGYESWHLRWYGWGGGKG